jgi:phage-related protein
MARMPVPGEIPLAWIGSSKRDFLEFPERVIDEMGNALGIAQFGGKQGKTMEGFRSRRTRGRGES